MAMDSGEGPEEGVQQVDICATVWYHVPQRVPSGTGYYWVKDSGSRDLHQAIRDAVHHHKFDVFSSLLECLPAEVLHHLGGVGPMLEWRTRGWV